MINLIAGAVLVLLIFSLIFMVRCSSWEKVMRDSEEEK